MFQYFTYLLTYLHNRITIKQVQSKTIMQKDSNLITYVKQQSSLTWANE